MTPDEILAFARDHAAAESDLLAGEKPYCDDALVEVLLGPLTEHLKSL